VRRRALMAYGGESMAGRMSWEATKVEASHRQPYPDELAWRPGVRASLAM